jgi:hypothetical protein
MHPANPRLLFELNWISRRTSRLIRGLVPEIHNSIQRLWSGCDPKTDACSRSIRAGDIDPFVRAFKIPAKDNLHRVFDRMSKLAAAVSINRQVNFVSCREVIGADARERPFMDFPRLLATLCHLHAGQPAFMLPAEAVEEWNPFFWRNFDVT